MAKEMKLTVTAENWISPQLEELLERLISTAEFYTPVLEALPVLEDDGGPVYDEEEGRTRCQAIS